MGSTAESDGWVRKASRMSALQKAKRGSLCRRTTTFLLFASREPKYPCIASSEVHSGGIQAGDKEAASFARPAAQLGNNGDVACRN